MDTGNMTVLPENITTAEMDPITSILRLALPVFTLVSLLVGTVSNGFFLWVLRVKMTRTVNTLWFSHLILTSLLFCLFLPFFTTYIFLGYHWVFGIILCKLINCSLSLALFASIFLLMVISLDRYFLISHPVWCQRHRTIPWARKVIAGVWLTSLILSIPYLAFRETRKEKDKIKCYNNYAVSSNWNGEETWSLGYCVHLAFTGARFLLGFLLPFSIITGCYYGLGREMKKRKLVRTRKPFFVLVTAVTSFFVFWLPYHLFQASLLIRDLPARIVLVLMIVTIIGGCLNFCFTPMLCLLVGEKFQRVSKTALLALFKKTFAESNENEEGYRTMLKMSRRNHLPSPCEEAASAHAQSAVPDILLS